MPLSSMDDVVRIKNITLSGSANVNNIVFYDANKAKIGKVTANGSANAFHVDVVVKDGCYQFNPHAWLTVNPAFFRFSCGGITDETIVTVNEEIKDEPVTPNTNLLPLAVNADGTPFVGTNGEDGYKLGYRIS